MRERTRGEYFYCKYYTKEEESNDFNSNSSNINTSNRGWTTVTVDVVLGGALEMFPAAIGQKEKHLVRLTGNLYAFLPYPVTTQSTRVNLASRNVESYTKAKPVDLSDSNISYSPYSNIAPLTAAEMVIHGENTAPMLVVTRLQRLIELSMWGNIAIEETIDVAHKGAQLKGSFSR